MSVKIEPSWNERLRDEFAAPYFRQLVDFVHAEYRQGVCYPPGRQIFNAFNLCPFDKVKVVILGQDPYHEEGQAEGLCFSVADGVAFPPSLQNIFKEIAEDLGRPVPASGSLRRWAEQGVLLLNATHRPLAPSRAAKRTPLAPLRLSRIFRQSPFLSHKRLPRPTRRKADRMVNSFK